MMRPFFRAAGTGTGTRLELPSNRPLVSANPSAPTQCVGNGHVARLRQNLQGDSADGCHGRINARDDPSATTANGGEQYHSKQDSDASSHVFTIRNPVSVHNGRVRCGAPYSG